MSTTFALPLDAGPSPVRTASPAVAFKDWSLVCAALDSGRQSLILRKGGIAEGRDGFRFKHESFFLFPTQFHQQAERVRPEFHASVNVPPLPLAGSVEIRNFFAIDWAFWLDDWSALERLAPFHIWREDVVRERFDYGDQPGLQCAFGRVYRLGSPWTFPDRPSFGGCRSWITLPDFPLDTDPGLHQVLDEGHHRARAGEVRAALGL